MAVRAVGARSLGSQMVHWPVEGSHLQSPVVNAVEGSALGDLLCMNAVGVPARMESLAHLCIVDVLCPGVSRYVMEGVEGSGDTTQPL
eukprot:3727897-Rhodomonas_salina.1